MSGYQASARIVRASPRLARAGANAEQAGWAQTAELAAIQITHARGAPDHGPSAAERLVAFRERWSQLTFFLFDADSWRT